jgi:Flp pilus assembly protein TadB
MGIASELLALMAAAGLLGAFLYWIFQAPERARKRRLQAVNLNRSHHQPWDQNIGARRRER